MAYYISLKTALLGVTLASLPVQGQVWACCVPRAVCQACVCHASCDTFKKKTGRRRSKLLGSNVGVFLFIRIICINVFFVHTYFMYLAAHGAACRNSGFLVQGQVWGTLSSKFGRAACRAPCVSCMRACAVCHAILFVVKKEKQAAGRSKLLGSNVCVFCPSYSLHIYLFEDGTGCRNSGFSMHGQIWGTLSSKVGRAACRVP